MTLSATSLMKGLLLIASHNILPYKYVLQDGIFILPHYFSYKLDERVEVDPDIAVNRKRPLLRIRRMYIRMSLRFSEPDCHVPL